MAAVFDESWFLAAIDEIGQEATLPDEEAFHLRKVLRVPIGTTIRVSNGNGKVFDCLTLEAGGQLIIRSQALHERQPDPPPMNLALAVLKGRDLEEPVEGLCQLPIRSIRLLVTDHSQVFKGQDFAKPLERLRQKSAVATKQAKKAWLTRILEPMPMSAWLGQQDSSCVIAALPGPDSLPHSPQPSFHVLVGPEGGFSQAEMTVLTRPDAFRIGLGPTRIRATHAPLVAAGKMMGLGWI